MLSQNLIINDTKKNIKNNSINFKHKVLCIFITSKNKKLILARPFIKLSKRELLHFVGLFWRFLDQDENNKKNYFDLREDESDIRFVYQTFQINEIYLVVMTSDNLNLFMGLDLLKALHKSINQTLNEYKQEDQLINKIKERAYDLFFLIDDIVNPFCGLEVTDWSTLKNQSSMESKNEKEFTIIKKEKEDRAREDMIKGMEEIERLKRENRFVDNSISSEKIEQQNIQRQEVLNEIINNTRRSAGMNLKERLIQRILHNREEEMRIGKYISNYFKL